MLDAPNRVQCARPGCETMVGVRSGNEHEHVGWRRATHRARVGRGPPPAITCCRSRHQRVHPAPRRGMRSTHAVIVSVQRAPEWIATRCTLITVRVVAFATPPHRQHGVVCACGAAHSENAYSILMHGDAHDAARIGCVHAGRVHPGLAATRNAQLGAVRWHRLARLLKTTCSCVNSYTCMS